MKDLFILRRPVTIRHVDLGFPLQPLMDVLDYETVQVVVTLDSQLLGTILVRTHRQAVSAARLRQAIADGLELRLFDPQGSIGRDVVWANIMTKVVQHLSPDGGEIGALSFAESVSIVIPTFDRPEYLRDCLRSLMRQESVRNREIIVVDNHPESALTPPVVEEYPDIILVNEHRRGLSYARNAGILASAGSIVVALDDDVVVPPDWLERLVAPFTRSDVMAVTGNVLPFELETEAQQLFEVYGGLGRGFERLEANREWFDSFKYKAVPTWRLGATANAAFRKSIFDYPEIGMLEETLGAGMKTGCSEDTYLFYKILKAGFTITYEPTAYVYHKHRREMRAFRRQIYNYSKGHVAYHLLTLFRDKDLRALYRLVVGLPMSFLSRALQCLRRKSIYPLRLLCIEITGTLAGPWALWQSMRRVGREGRSEPCIAGGNSSDRMPDSAHPENPSHESSD